MSSISQQPIVHGVNVVNEKDFKQMKKKLESSWFLAKRKAPLSLFPKRICHEERHSVIVGTAFRNTTSGILILEYITGNLREELKEKLNTINFYSSLTNGTTNSAVNKKEAFFLLTFNPKPEGSNKVSVELSYFDLVEPGTPDAEGIVNAIEESFKGVKINLLISVQMVHP